MCGSTRSAYVQKAVKCIFLALFLHIPVQVDTSIIGGMIIEVGDKYIDMSVATKMRKAVRALQEAV